MRLSPLFSVLQGRAQLLIALLVVLSFVFPVGLNRESREAVRSVAELRAELARVRAASAQDKREILGAIVALREVFGSAVFSASALPDGGADAENYGPPLVSRVPSLSGRYFRAGSVSGAYIDGHSYYCGEETPFGVLSRVFPGGCLIDGQRYSLAEKRAGGAVYE